MSENRIVKLALRILRKPLLAWDSKAAASADVYLANSTSVARRVFSAYGIKAEVVHPPVSLDAAGAQKPLNVPDTFFVTVARSRGYKGTARIIEAWTGLKSDAHLVVVGDPPKSIRADNVHFVGKISDAELRWTYANAKALISVSREDFGLTPVEANSFGTPVLVLREGGFLDSTAEHVSGEFIDDDSVLSIRRAVDTFPDNWDSRAIVSHAEHFSSARFAEKLRAAMSRAIREHANAS